MAISPCHNYYCGCYGRFCASIKEEGVTDVCHPAASQPTFGVLPSASPALRHRNNFFLVFFLLFFVLLAVGRLFSVQPAAFNNEKKERKKERGALQKHTARHTSTHVVVQYTHWMAVRAKGQSSNNSSYNTFCFFSFISFPLFISPSLSFCRKWEEISCNRPFVSLFLPHSHSSSGNGV